MRWVVAPVVLMAGCSTATLDEQNFTAGTFGSVTAQTSESSGTPSPTTDEGSTTKDPSDPSDPTLQPETTAGPDTDPTDASTSGGSTGEASTSGESTAAAEESSSGSPPMESSESGPPVLPCSDGDLGEATGNAVASGTTVGASNDLVISCGSGGGVDDVYLWRAPSAGTYTFDLSGSSYDTAMAIFDPDCDGSELACNDDVIAGVLTSSITMDLAADEQVLIAIEGYMGATGNYVLDVNEGAAVDFSCAEGGDLGSATGNVASGTTAGASDSWSASCQATDGPDIAYGWTAPAAGSYTFSLVGSSYDTVLTLQSPDCTGAQLACDDDAVGLQSELSVNLSAGETVLVVIDGYNNQTGNYTLAIN